MNRKRSRLEKFFSFNHHRKRFGSNRQSKALQQRNLQTLKESIITGHKASYTYGSDKNLSKHLYNLQQEFSGQSELLHHHASLIVLLRRESNPTQNFDAFCHLWHTETGFLLKQLNTRWLVSAAETFIDHSTDPLEQAILLNASILINTIKLHESERFLQNTEQSKDNKERHHSLQHERLALFDGTAGFAVGTDDTLRNMKWRIDKIAGTHSSGKILLEIYDRIQKHDTVYSRFKSRHTRDKTAWW